MNRYDTLAGEFIDEVIAQRLKGLRKNPVIGVRVTQGRESARSRRLRLLREPHEKLAYNVRDLAYYQFLPSITCTSRKFWRSTSTNQSACR